MRGRWGQWQGGWRAPSRRVPGGRCSCLCPVSPPPAQEQGHVWAQGSCPLEAGGPSLLQLQVAPGVSDQTEHWASENKHVLQNLSSLRGKSRSTTSNLSSGWGESNQLGVGSRGHTTQHVLQQGKQIWLMWSGKGSLEESGRPASQRPYHCGERPGQQEWTEQGARTQPRGGRGPVWGWHCLSLLVEGRANRLDQRQGDKLPPDPQGIVEGSASSWKGSCLWQDGQEEGGPAGYGSLWEESPSLKSGRVRSRCSWGRTLTRLFLPWRL